jgi:hypothetical protein
VLTPAVYAPHSLSARRRRVDAITVATHAKPSLGEPSEREWSGVEADEAEGETAALNGRQIRAPFSPEVELRTVAQSLPSPSNLSSTISRLVPSRNNPDGYAQVPSTVHSDRTSSMEDR